MLDTGALEWKHLRGGVCNKKEGSFQPQTNLYNGSLDPGSVLVVFGEGASLIMDTLSGSLDTDGWLGFEGGPKVREWQCMTQRDWLFGPIYPTMTIEEQVGSLVSFQKTGDELESIVNSVLPVFDLASVRKEKVGQSKVSEQFDTRRKRIILATRLALGCPLNILYDPFADMAYEEVLAMMQSLKSFAEKTGSFLVVSVDAVGPQQAKLIELADKIMLASHSGKVIFCGTLFEASDHFKEYRADDAVSLCGLTRLDMSGPQRYMDTLRQISALEDAWSFMFSEEESSVDTTFVEPTLLSTRHQYVLLVRRFALLIRDTPSLLAIFIQSTLPILLVSFIFFRKPLASALGLTLRSSLFFSLAINNTFALAVPEALFFRSQYEQVEWEAGRYRLYRAWLVPLARLSVILPIRMALVVLLTVPLYFITGLRTDDIIHLFIFEGIILLNTIVSAVIGILIGAWTPSLEVTQLATVLIIDVFILFGGLGSPGNRPTWIIRWIQYVSPIYYTFRALLRNELVGRGQVDWAAYLRSVEIERLTVCWAVGGLLLVGTTGLALLLLHSTHITYKNK